tara:strand:- start:83 stop:766 length:684 start_codon:yes stop_codon:yes gene_type:complete
MLYNVEAMNVKTFTHNPVSVKMPDLKTDMSEGFRQYVLPSGGKYHSVTTVTGHKKNAFFAEWRRKNPKESRRVLNRGNKLHNAIEKYLNNEENFLDKLGPNEYILFEQLLPELNSIENITCQEVALWSDMLELAGRVDCIGEYNGKMSVIDFKGSTRNKRKEDIDNYFMQATAYAIMWQERTGIKIDNIAILMSCEDGTVSVFESNPMKHTRDLFQCIQDYKKTLIR